MLTRRPSPGRTRLLALSFLGALVPGVLFTTGSRALDDRPASVTPPEAQAVVPVPVAVVRTTPDVSGTRGSTARSRVAGSAAPRPAAVPDRRSSPRAVGSWEEGVIRASLAAGQTFAIALGTHGVKPAEVDALIDAIEPHHDFRRTRAGMEYALHDADGDGAVDRLTLHPEPDIVIAVSRVRERYVASVERPEPRIEEAVVTGRISTSLHRAVREAGERPALAVALADLLSWQVDFSRDPRPGDTIRVLVEKRWIGERLDGYGRVLAVEYEGGRKSHAAYWFSPVTGEDGGHFAEDGRSARGPALVAPLVRARVTSKFDGKRLHPVLGFTKAHNGTDYAAPRGTPVRVIASGRVVHAGRQGPRGKVVIVEHDDGLTSYYAHLSSIARTVKPGVRVHQASVVGRVGSTGRSTGPHLHLGVKRDGRWIDPETLDFGANPPIAEPHRGRFVRRVQDYRARLDGSVAPTRLAEAADIPALR